MKIGIDVSQIVYETGVSTYTRNLVRSLLDIDSKNNYLLFGSSLRRRKEIEVFYKNLGSTNFKGIALPFPPAFLDVLWNNIHMFDVENVMGSMDIFHSSDWTQPPSRGFKVTTVHDLVPILYPEWSHPKIVAVFNKRLRWVMKEVDAVISVSETTKNDLVRFGFDKKKIVVIPEAIDPVYKPAEKSEIDRVKTKYKLGEKYLMTVGVTERKNIKNTVKAFMKVQKGKYRDMNLAVVGHPYIDISDERGVKLLGHVDSVDFPILYSGAEALVYASFYEGFGLPVLEAMASGTVVVTSNVSSMPEVVGNAGVLVNPESVDEIAKGIRTALAKSDHLIKLGVKRARQFSWKKTAKETLKVYNKAR